MRLKEFNLDDYLFGFGVDALSLADRKKISRRVEHEMMEIFYGQNMVRR
jgi:S-adenosylmethionine decarboxylase